MIVVEGSRLDRAEAGSRMLEAGLSAPPQRSPIRSFRDLEVYQRGRALQPQVYLLTQSFPDIEKFDLADQMRRACKSVPTNVAEGYAKRDSVKEFKRYLRVAMASANEMEVHLETAVELGYVNAPDAQKLIAEYQIVGKQLHRLIENWRSSASPASSL
jgi:four helix bundle protein